MVSTDRTVESATIQPPVEHSQFGEQVLLSSLAGLSSALPTALLVVLDKPNWVVVTALLAMSLTTGAGIYAFGRKRRKAQRLRARELTRQEPKDTESAFRRAAEVERWRQRVAAQVFAVLWQRPNPTVPMDTKELARRIIAAEHDLADDELPAGETIRVIEEIRLLGWLPTLNRNQAGFYLEDDDFAYNRGVSIGHKRSIAETAAAHVRSGMTIGLDGGTTTLQVARSVAVQFVTKEITRLRVVTNSLQISMCLLEVRECREAIRLGTLEVWSLAGPLHASCWTMDPPPAELSPWPLDLAIIGANGITNDGFFLPTERGLAVKQTLIRQADSVLIVADSTKLGRALAAKFCGWDARVLLITNAPHDPFSRKALSRLPRQKIIQANADVAS